LFDDFYGFRHCARLEQEVNDPQLQGRPLRGEIGRGPEFCFCLLEVFASPVDGRKSGVRLSEL